MSPLPVRVALQMSLCGTFGTRTISLYQVQGITPIHFQTMQETTMDTTRAWCSPRMQEIHQSVTE